MKNNIYKKETHVKVYKSKNRKEYEREVAKKGKQNRKKFWK